MAGVDALPSRLRHPALTVQTFLGSRPHIRRYFQVVGLSPPNHYLVHNSSINNLVRGVLTRVFYVKGQETPQPPEGIYRLRLGYFAKLLWKRFPSTTPVTRQDFVGFYRGRKATIYQQAVDSLATSSVSHRDARIKAFVKAEFINSDDKPDPDPRVISPRDPRYNVEVGRYLRPVEHQIYGAIASIFGSPTVLKGFNSQQTGAVISDKWSKFRNPAAIGLDASRFDQHVSKQALKWEHSIYNGMFHSPELARLLRWQLINQVTGNCRDGRLKYKTNGCRMSGDMNTALGNCLIMCALVHAYAKHVGVVIELINNGDDCVVFLERGSISVFNDGLSEWFLEMGFNMKVESPVFDIEKIEFCQTHPVNVDGTWLMVRNFPKGLAKDCLSLKDLSSPAICRAWLMAVGEGGLSLTGGVPVYQEFYCAFSRSAHAIRARHTTIELEGGLYWMSRGMERRFRAVSDSTRYSFWLAFGVTPEAQIALEDYYSKVTVPNIVKLGESGYLPSWF